MASILTPITDPIPGLYTNWGTNADHSVGTGVFASDEVKIDAVNKLIQLRNAGNLAAAGSGATGQALYSFLKYVWKNQTELTQYDFPMLSITNEQFEFIDGWEPEDDTTRKMIRTAGWAETNGTLTKRRYSGIISLGTLGTTDQPYFVQNTSLTASTTNTDFTGPVNEPVKIYAYGTGTNDINFTSTSNITSTTTDLSVFADGDIITISGTTGGTNDGTFVVSGTPTATSLDITTTDFTASGTDTATVTITSDYKAYFKIFVREREKTYADADLDVIGVSEMTYIVYRFPVANADDININTTADTDIDSDNVMPADVSPYDVIDVTYLDAQIKGAWTNSTVYVANDVVQSAGRWYITTAGGTSSGTGVADDVGVTDWAAYSGEREVETGVYSAYTVILDANNAGTTPGGSKEAVYEWAQWALRLTGTIDTASTRNGEIADALVYFVGDNLHTSAGVFVDDIAAADVNKITFHDYADVTHTYPSVVTVTINFNGNLAADADAIFRAYYTNVPSGNFGDVDAIEVTRADGVTKVGSDVSNNVPDGAIDVGSSYSFSYAYDGDTTGGRTQSTDTNITVVAIGLTTGQYVSASQDITSTGATISLVAPFERNYDNPA